MTILDHMNCGGFQTIFPSINCKFSGLDGKINSQQISCLILLVKTLGVRRKIISMCLILFITHL